MKPMENEQTAVQWLIEQIKSDQTKQVYSLTEWEVTFKIALEMELKQREEAYSLGELNAAQYFTDTYQK